MLPTVLPSHDRRMGRQRKEGRDAVEAAGKIDGVFIAEQENKIHVRSELLASNRMQRLYNRS